MQKQFCLKLSRKLNHFPIIGMEVIRKIKSPQVFFVFSLLVVIVYLIFSSPIDGNNNSNIVANPTEERIKLEIENYEDLARDKQSILINKILPSVNNLQTKSFYSIWPNFFFESSDNFVQDNSPIHNKCDVDLKIENFRKTFQKWSTINKLECKRYFNAFTQIYDVTFKQNQLTMNDKLRVRVREWLGNKDELLKQSYAQVNFFNDN
jgi:hypothetical protein